MFNKGKSNQESSKRISWNESSSRSRYPVVEWIPYLFGKKRGKELEIAPDPFLANYFTESLWNDTLSHSTSVFN